MNPMNNEVEFQNGCREEFEELCALSTSGELSAKETAMLEEHVAGCAPCAALLREYTSLAHVGMAKLAAERGTEIETPFGHKEAEAEKRFAAAFHATQQARRSNIHTQVRFSSAAGSWNRVRRPVLLIGTAAALLICIGSAFELGRRMNLSSPHTETVTVERPPIAPDRESTQLKAELAAAQSSLKASAARSEHFEKRLAVLSDTKTSLESEISRVSQKDNVDSTSLSWVTQQRDSLQQQLNDTSSALTRARDVLNRAQVDRQGALYRVATLETEVDDLNARLSQTNSSAASDEKFLAADRDIRELMGARQLYIADVFDVQNDGKPSKPFGRVFFTKGKSLIFYAFDLEKQPGYRETKAFQAWGQSDRASAKPISIGVFYRDSEQNRRWVVKSDNQEILAQINSVFVTVEPHGGSQEPSSKPFLEAFLHSLPPNHP